jgi:hypothetical protein
MASLQKATAGITYTPNQIKGLTSLATQRGSSPGSLNIIKNAPLRPVVDTNPNLGVNSTSTGGVSQTFTYPTTLPALTAEQQEALMTRRRLATRGLEETQNVVQRERDRAQADTLRQQSDIERQQQSQSREGMQTLAGRGVARGPMFVNPFQRRLAEGAQRQTAELQSGLAATLSSLESALRQADLGRERELSQIDFDAMSMRSDLDRLLGA